MSSNHRLVNYSVDVLSVGAILGTLAGYLPAIAAFGAIVWYAIQIYESKTVQAWLRIRRHRARRKRLEWQRQRQSR